MKAPGFTFAYIASPYTRFAGGLERASDVACRAAADLIRCGVPCYSPIAHSHAIAMKGGLDPVNHHLWLLVDKPMMRSASALIVITAEGWRESLGVQAEIAFFSKANRPIIYADPGLGGARFAAAQLEVKHFPIRGAARA
jgi:hypothetical protein